MPYPWMPFSPADSGIWSDRHAQAFVRITKFIKENGAVPAVQLAHAGRKASSREPWADGSFIAKQDGGWTTFAP